MLSSDLDSDEESFKSVQSRSQSPSNVGQKRAPAMVPKTDVNTEEQPAEQRFTPAEEAKLLSESNELKTSANTLFGKGSYSEAIPVYDRALSSVPNYLDYELAVLKSNIAACHIKLAEWKEAIESATRAADNLERLDPVPKPKREDPTTNGGKQDLPKSSAYRKTRLEPVELATPQADDSKVEEVDDEAEKAIERLAKSGHSLQQVQTLRIKILMRRAKARTETGGWSALQGADEDYRYLLTSPALSPSDRRTVQGSLAALGPRLEEAKSREMAEMMGKLKGLGNSILKPFGLSTDNFQFTQGEGGGYSMNFNQNPGKK